VVAVPFLFLTLPDVRPLARSFPKTTSFMELRRQALARAGQSPRLEWIPVPLSRISPWLRRAVIAAEDARFYEHGGVDWDAVREAAGRNWERGALRAGASTITQQLAKNLYLSPSRTPWRKLRELAITRELESTLSKDRILELYLNVVEFGPRTYGAEAAARRYFGKTAASLSAYEAATLAAVIPSPRIYDPVRHPQRVERRARRILQLMRIPEGPPASDSSPPRIADPTSESPPPAESAGSRPPGAILPVQNSNGR
jgi:monofunctional glycosyltransferase